MERLTPTARNWATGHSNDDRVMPHLKLYNIFQIIAFGDPIFTCKVHSTSVIYMAADCSVSCL